LQIKSKGLFEKSTLHTSDVLRMAEVNLPTVPTTRSMSTGMPTMGSTSTAGIAPMRAGICGRSPGSLPFLL